MLLELSNIHTLKIGQVTWYEFGHAVRDPNKGNSGLTGAGYIFILDVTFEGLVKNWFCLVKLLNDRTFYPVIYTSKENLI